MPIESIDLTRRSARADGKKGKDGKKADNFAATPEELRGIQNKMHDPEFAKLMYEYMQSLQDPETLREEQQYLEQVEREANEGGDYSFEFVFPQPAFVVELLQPDTREATAKAVREVIAIPSSNAGATDTTKASTTASATSTAAIAKKSKKNSAHDSYTDLHTYVNFCTSDKIEEFHEETSGDRMGSHWHVPVSVSQRRLGRYDVNDTHTADARTTPTTEAAAAAMVEATQTVCYLYDAVFHPKTLLLANRSDRFLCFVVEIAVEQINAGYKHAHGFEFRRLPSSVKSVCKPLNQTLRRKVKDGKPVPLFAPDRSAPVLTRPTKHMDSSGPTEKCSAPSVDSSNTTRHGPSGDQSATQVTSSSTISCQGAVASTNINSNSAGSGSASHSCDNRRCMATESTTLPPFTITHRGRIDLSEAWQWKVSDRRIGVPEELAVRMTFDNVKRAAALDVHILDDGSALKIETTTEQTRYHGLLVLPFSVELSVVSARYERASGTLTLLLKVVPPVWQDGRWTASQVRQNLGLEQPPIELRPSNTDTKATSVRTTDSAEATTAESTSSQSGASSTQDGCDSMNVGDCACPDRTDAIFAAAVVAANRQGDDGGEAGVQERGRAKAANNAPGTNANVAIRTAYTAEVKSDGGPKTTVPCEKRAAGDEPVTTRSAAAQFTSHEEFDRQTNIAAEGTTVTQGDDATPLSVGDGALREVHDTNISDGNSSGGPITSHIQDGARVQAMLDKVRAARCAREAALNAAAAARNNESDAVEDDNSKAVLAPVPTTIAVDATTTTTTSSSEIHVTPAPAMDSTIVDCPPATTATDTPPVTEGHNTVVETNELTELRTQQDAWMDKLTAEMECMAEQERMENELAEQAVAAQALMARKKVEATLAEEQWEAKMRARMTALPLISEHIFAID